MVNGMTVADQATHCAYPWRLSSADTCSQTLACRNRGYVDPNNCNVCKCPEGFGGRLCDGVDPGTSGMDATAIISLATPTPQPRHAYPSA